MYEFVNNLDNLIKIPFVHGAAIDFSHGMLLLGTLLSVKPISILEIGIGTGFCSEICLKAIEYNNKGSLTCVDNLYDLGGNLPNSVLKSLKDRKVNVMAPMNERDFVNYADSNSYDFLVSDGDHEHAGEWTDKIFDIIKPNSFMFFHDVCAYENLMNYKLESDKLNKPNFLFNLNSRPDERSERGWLMVINKK